MGLFNRLKHYSESWWYDPFLGFLAAIDAYVFVVPVETIMVPSVLLNKKRWLAVGLWVSTGSALGAATFAYLASHLGPEIVHKIAPGLIESHAWERASEFLRIHGFWGLTLISMSPIPQHAAVAAAGLAHMNAILVFAGVWLGRTVKYVPLCWAIVHAPDALKWFGVKIHRHGDHSSSAKTPK